MLLRTGCAKQDCSLGEPRSGDPRAASAARATYLKRPFAFVSTQPASEPVSRKRAAWLCQKPSDALAHFRSEKARTPRLACAAKTDGFDRLGTFIIWGPKPMFPLRMIGNDLDGATRPILAPSRVVSRGLPSPQCLCELAASGPYVSVASQDGIGGRLERLKVFRSRRFSTMCLKVKPRPSRSILSIASRNRNKVGWA
jgi:hypothetical protein